METDLKIFDVVDSTNDTLEELADKGAPEGTCVIAMSQRKGRGRSGRSFYSPDGGNLYMSLLLKPRSMKLCDLITIIAAVATVEAVREVFGIDTGIKWVNDIILDSKKICGIIATARNLESEDRYVILGIGMNIYESRFVPEDIRGKYGSVFGRSCDLSADESRDQVKVLAGTIIRRFSYYYEQAPAKEVISQYRRYCIIIGRQVEYMSGSDIISARVAGIDDNGGIVLDINGALKTFRDGEIRINCDHMNLA